MVFFCNMLGYQWWVTIFASANMVPYTEKVIPYARHYKPRIVYFLPHFSHAVYIAERLILQTIYVKVAFIQKVRVVFQISKSKKNIPNYYPELEIWICCLLLLAGNLNFKFRIVIWNIFLEIWRFEKHFLKKSHLYYGGSNFESTFLKL